MFVVITEQPVNVIPLVPVPQHATLTVVVVLVEMGLLEDCVTHVSQEHLTYLIQDVSVSCITCQKYLCVYPAL